MKIAVLAGSYKEYKDFLFDSNLTRNNDVETFIYVESMNKSYGFRFNGLILYGTWYTRKDAIELKERILYNLR